VELVSLPYRVFVNRARVPRVHTAQFIGNGESGQLEAVKSGVMGEYENGTSLDLTPIKKFMGRAYRK
jgi:hypothetical protein